MEQDGNVGISSFQGTGAREIDDITFNNFISINIEILTFAVLK